VAAPENLVIKACRFGVWPSFAAHEKRRLELGRQPTLEAPLLASSKGGMQVWWAVDNAVQVQKGTTTRAGFSKKRDDRFDAPFWVCDGEKRRQAGWAA
jgi:hypothetical protein